MGSTRSSRLATSLVSLSGGGGGGGIFELVRARPRDAEALRGVADLGVMQLQPVALALAIGDHQHHHMPARVDEAARSFLIVKRGFKRIRSRRRDDVQSRDRLPVP